MKIIAISDTHGLHNKMPIIPNGDVLVHAGDVTNIGERFDVEGFLNWFQSLPHKHKIFIAGNHDRSFDPKFNKEINPYWDIETTAKFNTTKPFWLQDLLKTLEGTNTHYLEDSSVTIDGINFWGSPWTPWFHGQYWAFNQHRGSDIKKYWDMIPMNTDVLITHGPPAHKLDWCESGDLVGCHDLTYTIQMVKPIYHIFGHIHESYGVEQTIDCTYVNASMVNAQYRPGNKAIVINL